MLIVIAAKEALLSTSHRKNASNTNSINSSQVSCHKMQKSPRLKNAAIKAKQLALGTISNTHKKLALRQEKAPLQKLFTRNNKK